MRISLLTHAAADAILAGEPQAGAVAARLAEMLGRPWRWLSPLARRCEAAFEGQTRPSRRAVVRFLQNDEGFGRACLRHHSTLSIAQRITAPQMMLPAPALHECQVPAIESPGALAEWLGLSIGELEWFADLRALERRKGHPKLRHYRYRILEKRSGGVRVIEAPKPRLKQLQQRILSEILERIPVHPSTHGFVTGRSIRTFVSPHAGRAIVLRMDLQDFFPSFRAARVQAFFRTTGYPDSVASLLTGLCTNAVPRDMLSGEARELYRRPHLPQGAPSSPALANLCCYRLDCRLAALAESAGVRYSRYADDLAFSGSGDFERRAERFSIQVAAILLEEGFAAQHQKTRIMPRGVQQHLAGLVVNRHPNVPRREFDRLKAILTNCARAGPQIQNRERHPNFRAHLEGRIAFFAMVNPSKAARLRAIFERIPWP